MSAHRASSVPGVDVLVRAGKAGAPLSCRLVGIANGRIHLCGDRWIEPSSHVTVSISRITLSGEVEYCTAADAEYRICVNADSAEEGTRREPRLSVFQTASATVLTDALRNTTEGVLIDLAVSGLSFEMATSAEVGAIILIETATSLIVGEVRHCQELKNHRFRAGIAITDIFIDARFQQNSGVTRKPLRRKLAEAVLGARINP